MNDYTNLKLPANILQSSQTFKQQKLLKDIPKTCLRQDFEEWNIQQSQRKESRSRNNHNPKNSMKSFYNTNVLKASPTTACAQKCSIQNPFLPQDKLDHPAWKKALQRNIQLIDEYILKRNTRHVYKTYEQHSHHTSNNNNNHNQYTKNQQSHSNKKITYDDDDEQLDVVFYGDSIIEEWHGRWMGTDMSSKQQIHSVFHKYFDPDSDLFHNQTLNTLEKYSSSLSNHKTNNNDDDDGDDPNIEKLHGLALGIAGDKTNNLLWRIQHGGELPQELQPKVFWLLIGTNDLTDNCSEDIVILGILAIVQELRRQRPDSIIVINGLLPRTDWKDGRLIGKEQHNTSDDYEKQDNVNSVIENYKDNTDGDDDSEEEKNQQNASGSSSSSSEEEQNVNNMTGKEEEEEEEDDDDDKVKASGDDNNRENVGDDNIDDHVIDNGADDNQNNTANLATQSSTTSSSLPIQNNQPGTIASSSEEEEEPTERIRRRRTDQTHNAVNNKENDIFNYWPSIQAINHQLKLYARKHDKVEFYDPSHLFLARMGNDYFKRNEVFLLKELQDDYLHPTALGHRIWAEVSKEKIMRILSFVFINY